MMITTKSALHRTPDRRRGAIRSLLFVALAGLSMLGIAGRGVAAPIITGLYPTGWGYTPGSVGADSIEGNWKLRAYAASGTFQPGYEPTGPAPYDAYVLESGSLPDLYLGGSNNFGYCGGLWVGLQNTPISIVDGPDPPTLGQFASSAVYSLTFTSTGSGIASFNFWGASDNAVAFFVGGTITTSTSNINSGSSPFDNAYNTGTNYPTITGGTQIGYATGFGTLKHFVGNAYVDDGSNTLYAVVYDYGRFTGFMFSPVPEPSSVVLAAIACGCIAAGSHRRWKRRKSARSADDAGGSMDFGPPQS